MESNQQARVVFFEEDKNNGENDESNDQVHIPPFTDEGGRGRKSTLMKYSKEVFISRVEIIDHRKIGGHISYVIRVRGRTKYLVSAKELAEIGLIQKDTYEKDQKMEEIRRSTMEAAGKQSFLDQALPLSIQNQSVEFNIVKRYSELLTFHNVLKTEMKNYMKKNNMNDFPEYPPKKYFFSTSKTCIDERTESINRYFQQLFEFFPQKVPFTNAIIDLCQPLRLSVAVIGAHKTGKSTLIKAFADLLTDQAEFKRSYQRTQAEKALLGKGKKQGDKNIRVSADFTTSKFIDEDLKMEDDLMILEQNQQDETFTDNQTDDCGANSKKKGKKGIIIKQRKKGDQIVTPLDDDDQIRAADSYFPLDIAYQASCGSNLLFRLEVQEYQGPTSSGNLMPSEKNKNQSDEAELKTLFSHILANDERNAFLFTYDTTGASSFKLYLKKAIKELIFAHEEVQEYKQSSSKKQQNQSINDQENSSQMVPFMIVGTKRDKKDKLKVTREECSSLVQVLKKHMKCDHFQTEAENPSDISQALNRLLSLASSHLFPHYQHMNQCSTNTFQMTNSL